MHCAKLKHSWYSGTYAQLTHTLQYLALPGDIPRPLEMETVIIKEDWMYALAQQVKAKRMTSKPREKM